MTLVTELGLERLAAHAYVREVENELTDAMREALDDGETITNLAKQSGLSRPTIYDRLKQKKEAKT